jgi:hypothetical protein
MQALPKLFFKRNSLSHIAELYSKTEKIENELARFRPRVYSSIRSKAPKSGAASDIRL